MCKTKVRETETRERESETDRQTDGRALGRQVLSQTGPGWQGNQGNFGCQSNRDVKTLLGTTLRVPNNGTIARAVKGATRGFQSDDSNDPDVDTPSVVWYSIPQGRRGGFYRSGNRFISAQHPMTPW